MLTFTQKQFVLFALLCFTFCFSSKAQDHIHLLSGEVLEVKIKSMTGQYVEYKRANQTDADIEQVSKKKIDQVKMGNGTTLFFNRLPKTPVESEIPEATPPKEREQQKKPAISAQKINIEIPKYYIL